MPSILAEGTQSPPIRTPLSHLVSNEELVINGEGHGVTRTEPPHWSVDGVSRHLPLLGILLYQWHHIRLVPGYVDPG